MCVSNCEIRYLSHPEGGTRVSAVCRGIVGKCAGKCVVFGGRLGEVRARGVSEVGKSRELGPPRAVVSFCGVGIVVGLEGNC